MRSVEESLRRLQTDVIDVFLAHDVEFGDREVIVHETLPALHRLKEQGKIRYTGITGYPLGFLKTIVEASDVDTVLSYCHYTLLDTTLDAVLRPLARARGIGLINASPLHMGMLTPAGPPSWHPASEAVRAKTRNAAQWCEKQGVDLAALALQFALGYEHAATTLVGMSRPEEVTRNVQAVGTAPDPDLVAAVREILHPVLDQSWPSGLPENNEGALARLYPSSGIG
jgi:L-galactose dehydrogenase